jgi:hypothetical protein
MPVLLAATLLRGFGLVESASRTPPPFFVSVASKGLKHYASPLFATHTRRSISVASKGVMLHQSCAPLCMFRGWMGTGRGSRIGCNCTQATMYHGNKDSPRGIIRKGVISGVGAPDGLGKGSGRPRKAAAPAGSHYPQQTSRDRQECLSYSRDVIKVSGLARESGAKRQVWWPVRETIRGQG